MNIVSFGLNACNKFETILCLMKKIRLCWNFFFLFLWLGKLVKISTFIFFYNFYLFQQKWQSLMSSGFFHSNCQYSKKLSLNFRLVFFCREKSLYSAHTRELLSWAHICVMNVFIWHETRSWFSFVSYTLNQQKLRKPHTSVESHTRLHTTQTMITPAYQYQ